MQFKIFDVEEGERQVGDFGEGTYEDMYEAASRDVWKLMPIVDWIEKLEEETVWHAIRALRLQGHNKEANTLELWLKGKPQ